MSSVDIKEVFLKDILSSEADLWVKLVPCFVKNKLKRFWILILSSITSLLKRQSPSKDSIKMNVKPEP